MGGVGGKELLAGLVGDFERRLEHGEGGDGIPAGIAQPPALHLDPGVHDGAAVRQRLRLLDQPVSFRERVAQALDPGKLRQHPRPARARRLLLELVLEAALRSIEVVEVPKRAETVSHRTNSKAAGSHPSAGTGRGRPEAACIIGACPRP